MTGALGVTAPPPVTACEEACTAASPASIARCGNSAKAMMTSTSGTITSPSRNDISNDVTAGPWRLCIARMYIRSA